MNRLGAACRGLRLGSLSTAVIGPDQSQPSSLGTSPCCRPSLSLFYARLLYKSLICRAYIRVIDGGDIYYIQRLQCALYYHHHRFYFFFRNWLFRDCCGSHTYFEGSLMVMMGRGGVLLCTILMLRSDDV